MKKTILSIALLVTTFSISSCNSKSDSSSFSNPSSESIGSSENSTENGINSLNSLKEKLLQFDDVVSRQTYSTSQEDYYGISMEVSETGTTTMYQDNFIVREYNQTIGKGTYSVRNEIGIYGSNIYDLNYYGENQEENSVKYYVDNETNRKYIFNISFVNEYINNIINVTLNYFETSGLTLSLQTNYDSVDLTTDGQKELKYRFINYAANGRDKIEEVERDDTLFIKNGKIISSKTIMLYSLQDGTNYHYMEKDINYEYADLLVYEGEKINPESL